MKRFFALAPGYSMLELLVVLAIMGLIATVAVPVVSTSVERMTLGADARSLATQLRDLREAALDEQKDVVVTVEGGNVTVLNGEALLVSSGTAVEIMGSRFVIDAEGAPTGSFRLLRGNSSVRIVANPLTGRFAVTAEP
jgi:prepilin-type N-terminal cleavage/methylation domain-containing protein